MAIEKITAPSAVPASTADWEAVLDIQAALLLAVQGAERIVGSNVVKGAVFLVGGATYLATADTAITGSASDYVKLTVSLDGLTLAPSYVADLTGVAWDSANNGYYDVDGNLYVFDEARALKAGTISVLNTRLGIAAASSGHALYTTSGSWTCPAGVTKVLLTGVGGGGNGGNGGTGHTVGTCAGGGGGGGGGSGAWGIKIPVTVIPGETYAIQIGVALATTFGSLLSIAAGGNGGNGGNASSGTPGSAGSAGAAGSDVNPLYSGVAGAAGSAGGNEQSLGGGIYVALGGNGGDSGKGGLYLYDGGYSKGVGANVSTMDTHATAGAAATRYGCGGGGGGGGGSYATNLRSNGLGGAGQPGYLLVEW